MAIKKEIDIIVNKDKAVSGLKEVDKGVKQVDNSTSDLTSKLDALSGGAVTSFKNFKAGLSTVISGFKSLKVAIIGTGIGALIIGIIALREAFTASEEGQNKFAKILGVIGSITGNLIELLGDLGENIISIFENPKKAITDFANLIKDQIFNRFTGLLELIPQLGKAVTLLFKGDFAEAGKVALDATAKVITGVENLSEKIGDASERTKEFIKEMEREAKLAGEIADQRAKADKIDRKLIVERAEADRKRAELLEKSQDKQNFNAKERIDFLKQASKIEEEITNKEIESAKIREKALLDENTITKSNKDALNAEAEAKAKIINLETQRIQKQKELTAQISGLIDQENAQSKALLDTKKRELEELQKIEEEKIKLEVENEIKRQDAINAVRDKFREKLFELEEETKLQKLEREEVENLLELERLNASEQQKYEVRKYYAGLIAEEQQRIFTDFLDAEEQAETDAEDLRLKKAGEQIKLEENVKDAKINIANQTASLISELAGQGTALAKGVAVAQATMAGYEGVQNAYTTAQKSPITTLFPAYPIVQAGLAGAFSTVQIKKILSTNTNTSSGAVGGGGTVSAPTQSAPSFNLVQGTQSNQIAESVNANANRPIETFVVSSTVTSAQEADRNRIETASI